MGRRGPRPAPTALKRARGNPGKRRLNDREPTPMPGEPKCPPWLDAEGRKCWREIVRQLGKLGVLTHADRQALAVYCDTWSRWREASDFVRKHGAFLPVKDDSGKLKYLHQFPQVSIAQKLLTNLLRYQQEFGLTPSSRSGITTTGEREPDDLDLFRSQCQELRFAPPVRPAGVEDNPSATAG